MKDTNQHIKNLVEDFIINTNPCKEIMLDTEPQKCFLGSEEIVTRKVLFEKTDKTLEWINNLMIKENSSLDLLMNTHLLYVYSRYIDTVKVAESNFLPSK